MQLLERSPFRFIAYLAALAAASLVGAASAAGAVEVSARLVAPPGSESELKSATSLKVTALPAALLQPVAKGTPLVEMDLAKLEKEYEGQRKIMERAQAEKRRLASERGVTSSTPASSSTTDLSAAQAVADAQMAEANAISDLTRLQNEIATANLRAPANGYVLRQLYAVGAKAKRHKPLLVFVDAKKTVVEASVPAAEAAPFVVGAAVRVADAGNSANGFRATILSANPTGDSVALRLQPLELPFLALDAPASVQLSLMP